MALFFCISNVKSTKRWLRFVKKAYRYPSRPPLWRRRPRLQVRALRCEFCSGRRLSIAAPTATDSFDSHGICALLLTARNEHHSVTFFNNHCNHRARDSQPLCFLASLRANGEPRTGRPDNSLGQSESASVALGKRSLNLLPLPFGRGEGRGEGPSRFMASPSLHINRHALVCRRRATICITVF
jgi:hypothetical protein